MTLQRLPDGYGIRWVDKLPAVEPVAAWYGACLRSRATRRPAPIQQLTAQLHTRQGDPTAAGTRAPGDDGPDGCGWSLRAVGDTVR